MNLIAQVNINPVYIYDDIFNTEEEKENYLNASEEDKRLFITEKFYDNLTLDCITIDLYE